MSRVPGARGAAKRSATASGDALYRRVERRVPELARAMLETFVAEIPLYAQLPREQLDGEIREITEENLRLFFDMLRTGRLLTDDELAPIRVSAARRAEERVPLDAVLTAYHVGGRIGWQALVDGAESDETDAVVAAGTRVLSYVQQVSAAVASAYLEEQQTIYGEEREARRALSTALLSGESPDVFPERLGVHAAECYLVVALRFGAHPDEGDGGAGGAIAARRKLRRVQAALDHYAGEPVLGLLEAGGGTALVPLARDADVDASLETLAALLQASAGAAVVAAAAVADGVGDIARAANQAHDVLRLVRQLGHPPGAYRLRDVLIEYQLTRPSDAQGELASLLNPLDRNPDLPKTLEVYLDNDLDRRRTAAALHVHPNTLDYRLKRIVELTGLDPSTARGLQFLAAAVAARRLLG